MPFWICILILTLFGPGMMVISGFGEPTCHFRHVCGYGNLFTHSTVEAFLNPMTIVFTGLWLWTSIHFSLKFYRDEAWIRPKSAVHSGPCEVTRPCVTCRKILEDLFPPESNQ